MLGFYPISGSPLGGLGNIEPEPTPPTPTGAGYVILLMLGQPQTLTQDVTYALPSVACLLYSDAVVQVSNEYDTGFTSVAASTTGVEVSATFVKCTTTDAIVSLKRI